MDKMVRVVGLENVVMYQCMALERIAEKFYEDGPMHQVTMQCPFKQRAENNSGYSSDGAPKYEHRTILLSI